MGGQPATYLYETMLVRCEQAHFDPLFFREYRCYFFSTCRCIALDLLQMSQSGRLEFVVEADTRMWAHVLDGVAEICKGEAPQPTALCRDCGNQSHDPQASTYE